MRFEGFPDEGLVFYEGLEADNSKTYWTRHKADYETHVRAPLLALVEELGPDFGTAKVFRPYRDVRFSNDKTPYKTHQGAVLTLEGRAAAWYLQISAEGLSVSGGMWRMESDQVDRYRRAVLRLAAIAGRIPRNLHCPITRYHNQAAECLGIFRFAPVCERFPQGVLPRRYAARAAIGSA